MPEEPLEREEQLAPPPLQSNGASSPSLPRLHDPGDALTAVKKAFETPEMKALVSRMLDGTEPFRLRTPRQGGALQRFSPAHLQVVMLKIAGFRSPEIGAMTGYDWHWVRQILTHPYARQLIHTLMPMALGDCLDVRERIDVYANDLLERLYEIGMTTADEKVVTRIGFGMLDRAGFTPAMASVKPDDEPKEPELNENMFGRLAAALEQSNEIDARMGEDWKIKPSESEGSPSGGHDSEHGAVAVPRGSSPLNSEEAA